MGKGQHEKSKKSKKNKKSFKLNRKKLIIIVLMLIFIVCILISAFFIFNKYKSKNENNEVQELFTDPTETNENDEINKVKELQQSNPDIIGWLEIENTNISYPVLQGKDNDYYMTHNYKKEYSKEGSLFLDKDYDWSIPSTNLLIYGHNNRDSNEMFSGLMNYKEESYYKDHKIIRLTTDKEDADYEIISVFLSRVYYKSEKNVFRYYYFINAKTENEFNDFVNNAKKASLYDTGVTAEYGDQLLTLSTCSYHTTDGRLAVVAKKVKK